MIDVTEIEAAAMDDAGGLGGAYLESIGKTDLGELTENEWKTFIQTVCNGYVGSLVDHRDAANKAAGKVMDFPLARNGKG